MYCYYIYLHFYLDALFKILYILITLIYYNSRNINKNNNLYNRYKFFKLTNFVNSPINHNIYSESPHSVDIYILLILYCYLLNSFSKPLLVFLDILQYTIFFTFLLFFVVVINTIPC